MISSRRKFIGASAGMAALAGLGWHPSMARAAQGERKFLFFFAGGAWDTTTVFDPHYNTDFIDMDPMTQPQTVGRLTFTSGEDRPNVSRFFERWGRRTAVINGLDSHSVGHASGTQLTLTGTSASSYPDWPTALAANGRGEYPLPHLVFSGPSIPGNSGSAVVRAGGGTLMDMINSAINGNIDNPVPTFDPPADAIIDAYVHKRIAKFAAQHEIAGGEGYRRAGSFLSNTDRAMEIEGRQFEGVAGGDPQGAVVILQRHAPLAEDEAGRQGPQHLGLHLDMVEVHDRHRELVADGLEHLRGGDQALADQQVVQPLAGAGLLPEGVLELLGRHEAAIDENGADAHGCSIIGMRPHRAADSGGLRRSDRIGASFSDPASSAGPHARGGSDRMTRRVLRPARPGSHPDATIQVRSRSPGHAGRPMRERPGGLAGRRTSVRPRPRAAVVASRP